MGEDETSEVGDAGAAQSGGAAAVACRVRLFGEFAVTAADGRSLLPLGRKSRALLAYLILAGRPISRQALMALAWGDRGEEQARASLRQALYEARTVNEAGYALLQSDRRQVWADTSGVETDLDLVLAYANARDFRRLGEALRQPLPPLLADLDGASPDLDDWLASERARKHEAIRAAVGDAAASALERGETTAAKRLAAFLVEAEPFDEGAARLAMTAAAAGDDRAAAHRLFERLETGLKAEMGVGPSPETVALYRRLMQEGRGAAAPSDPAPTAVEPPAAERPAPALALAPASLSEPIAPTTTRKRARPWLLPAAIAAPAVAATVVAAVALWPHGAGGGRLIAVEPLKASDNDPGAQVVRLGLSDDLARAMLGNPARFSVGEVGQPGVSLSSAQLALTGDVATLGKALSAHVRLSNAADGAVLWSGDFSGDPAQAQALRERVATRVGSILNCALSTRNRGAAAIGDDVTRLYLDACDRIGDYDLNGALAPLRKVTSLAPGFARAWADLATTQTLAADDLPPAQRAAADREAAANARRALALDGQTGLAYYALAHALPGLSNWESRVALIAKGLQAEPDSSELNNAMGVELLRVGRTGEAISYLQRSANLDPLNPSKSLALIWTLAFSGQFDDAEALIAKEERLWPGNVMIWDTAFMVEAEAGDPAKALALLDDPQRPGVRDPQDVGVWRALIRARAQPTGPNVDAAVAALLAQPPSDQADVLQMAHDLSRLGRMDLAYQYASKAKPTDDGAIDLLFRSYMAPFRADPRFMALMARLGVVDVWRSTNHWPDFCTAAQPPYNCADEAAHALAREKSAG